MYKSQQFIIVSVIVSLFAVLGITIFYNNNSINSNNQIMAFVNKAPSCDSDEVKQTVLQIFKENDAYYKDIDPSSIDTIYIKAPVANDYNASIDKYYCKGTITLESKNGLRPNDYIDSNNFYKYVHTYKTIDNGVNIINKAILMQCPITYTSQISEGKTVIYTSDISSSFTLEQGGYIEVPGSREKIMQEKRKVKQEVDFWLEN